MQQIKVLVKRPGEPAQLQTVENTLEALQEIVGGYIETITFAEDACIICNEEGRLMGLPYNCNFCGMELVGTIIVAGTKGEEFADFPLIDVGSISLTYPLTPWLRRMFDGKD